ncbi:uncharacterized protein FOMMEDRAFT_123923 [Fomitiporia mediterranea MF3/22]|uniref:uncharacterized protein n=1 Tax=Fomitiporia mediterranea (strain MF3/22) TaxID=694068 RepID=UPI000440992B|nr:uncharacterized protein FOMMEDRAFT_123923 [Fomitiporia mediterranea MF3/22]EJD01864.1 hypothetical protein FOMMEDRAFT_123923 [Fomitiporia mediterranea MF3/22]
MLSKLFVAGALLISSLSAVNAQTGQCARTYVVQAGDNCDTIAAAQHVSTFQIHFVNPQINDACTNLAVDQVLCLGIVGQDCTTTAVVNSGDTCTSIEATARIPDATLKANNPNVNADCSNLRIGEVLCTSFQVFNYTTTA